MANTIVSEGIKRKRKKSLNTTNSFNTQPLLGSEPLITSSFREYLWQYDTLGHRILDFEQMYFPDVNEDIYRRLDMVLGIIVKYLRKNQIDDQSKYGYSKENAINLMKKISFVLKDLGFVYGAQDLLSRGLKTRRVDCDIYSFLYLSVADILKLPLYAVSVPHHVFVRWDPDERHNPLDPNAPENKNDFNWETTSSMILDDNHYKTGHDIPQVAISRGIFLRSMSSDETLLFHLSTIGYTLLTTKNYDSAEGVLLYVVKSPLINPLAYGNLGILYLDQAGRSGMREEMVLLNLSAKYLTMALKLNPNSYPALTNLGILSNRKRMYALALDYFDRAIKLEPNGVKAYWGRSYALRELGKFEDASRDIDMVEHLEYIKWKNI